MLILSLILGNNTGGGLIQPTDIVLFVIFTIVIGVIFGNLRYLTKTTSKPKANTNPEPTPELPQIKRSKYSKESPLTGAFFNGRPLVITKGEFADNRLPNAIKESWNNVTNLRGICSLCIDNGILDEIENAVDHLLELDPDKPSAQYIKASFYLAANMPEEALNLLQVSLKTNNTDTTSEYNVAPLYFGLSKVYAYLHNDVEMLSNLNKGLSIDPNPKAILDKYFADYRKSHSDEEYEQELIRIGKYEGSFYSQIQLARLYFERDDVLSAMKTFDAILPLPEKSKSWLGEIGSILNSNNCSKLAYTYYKKYYDTSLGAGVGSVFVKAMINLEMIEEAESFIHELMMLPEDNYTELNILTDLTYELDNLKIKQYNENLGEFLPLRPISATYDLPQWIIPLCDYGFMQKYQTDRDDYSICILPFASGLSHFPDGRPDYTGYDLARQIQLFIQDSIYLRTNLTAVFETQFDEANHRQLRLEEPMSDDIIAQKIQGNSDYNLFIWGETYFENNKIDLTIYIQGDNDSEKHTINLESDIASFEENLNKLISDIMKFLPETSVHEPELNQFSPILSYFSCLNLMHSQIVCYSGIIDLELDGMTRRTILSLFNVITATLQGKKIQDLTLLYFILFSLLLNNRASGSEIYKEFEIDIRNTFAYPPLSETYLEVIGDLYGYVNPNSATHDYYVEQDKIVHDSLMASSDILNESNLMKQSVSLDKSFNLSIRKPVTPNVIEATYSLPQWVLALNDCDIVNNFKYEHSDYRIKILSFSSSESRNAYGIPTMEGFGLAREFSLIIHEALYLNCNADVVLAMQVDEANKKFINSSTVPDDDEINRHFASDHITDCYIWGDVKFSNGNVHLTLYSKERDSVTMEYTLDSTLKALADDLIKFIRGLIPNFPLKDATKVTYPISDPMPFYIYSAITSLIFRQNAYSSGLITTVMRGETRFRLKDIIGWLKTEQPEEHKNFLIRLLLAILFADKHCGNYVYEEFFMEAIKTVDDPDIIELIDSLGH